MVNDDAFFQHEAMAHDGTAADKPCGRARGHGDGAISEALTIELGAQVIRGDEYFVKVQCNGVLPIDNELGLKAPSRDRLPEPLRRFVIDKPVVATVTSVQGKNEEGEFIVVVDKGENAKLKRNMPLCSPKRSGKRWMAWVSDANGPHQAEVRVIEWDSKKSAAMPVVGETLMSVQSECFSQ